MPPLQSVVDVSIVFFPANRHRLRDDNNMVSPHPQRLIANYLHLFLNPQTGGAGIWKVSWRQHGVHATTKTCCCLSNKSDLFMWSRLDTIWKKCWVRPFSYLSDMFILQRWDSCSDCLRLLVLCEIWKAALESGPPAVSPLWGFPDTVKCVICSYCSDQTAETSGL